MATWCGYCERLLEELESDRDPRRRVDLVSFFDAEYEDAMTRHGRSSDGSEAWPRLVHPERLRGKRLPLYFAKRDEFDGLVQGYPTLLSCSAEGCRGLERSELFGG